MHWTLDMFEHTIVDPDQANPGLAGALVYLLGDGDVDEGWKLFWTVRRKQVLEYLHRLDVAGLGGRRETGRLHPALAGALEDN